MKKPIPLSIIIVNYKADKFLPRLRKNLATRVNIPFELVIVNNNQHNRGFARGANIGARRAQGRFLLFLNPDTDILQGDFATALARMRGNPRLGILGLRLQLPDGTPQPYSFGEEFSLGGRALRLLRIRPPRLDWVSGGAMLVRASLFSRLGGFDERFFMYFEDQDFCLRARQAGYEIARSDAVIITHFGGMPRSGGLARDRQRQIARYRRSQSAFIRKRHSLLYWLLFRFLRIFFR